MKNEKFLPLGSVVSLKEGEHKLMIIGYCSTPSPKEKKIYDYIGCAFPEGLFDLEHTFLFNHNEIFQLIHEGYTSEEVKKYTDGLKTFEKMYVGTDGMLKKTPEELMANLRKG